MRISGKKPPERAARSSRAAPANASKKSPSAGPASSVRASVSAEARSLADQGGIDQAKVERLRGLIESGQFVVDSQVIAERILATGG